MGTLSHVWARQDGKDGIIESLNVSGGASRAAESAGSGSRAPTTITLTIMLRAYRKIRNSNLQLEVIAPDGTVVATNDVGVPAMQPGDTYVYNWTIDTSGFPAQGTYTATACWSPGNSQNCLLGYAVTTFYAVPTFGPILLGIAGVGLGGWLWKLRREGAFDL